MPVCHPLIELLCLFTGTVDPKLEDVVKRFRKVEVTEEVLRSRRGTILGYGGGVAARRQHMNKMIKQSSKSGLVKTLEQQLEEVSVVVSAL